MTSLTRELLLALKPEVQKFEVEHLGTVFIKPLTELARSRRMTEAYGKDAMDAVKKIDELSGSKK